MGNILENIGKIHIAVVKDKEAGGGELGQTLGEFAVAAIMGGIGSPAWKTYMSIFADNADQLKLLTEVGTPEDDYLPQTRAYIVSNAVCAAGTNTATTNGVNRQKLASAVANVGVDGTVTKPAAITALLAALGE